MSIRTQINTPSLSSQSPSYVGYPTSNIYRPPQKSNTNIPPKGSIYRPPQKSNTTIPPQGNIYRPPTQQILTQNSKRPVTIIRQGKPKGKNWWIRILVIIVVLIIIAVIFFLLYFLVFNTDSDDIPADGEIAGRPAVPAPPADYPIQYGGSGGECDVDTDCPLVYEVSSVITQYCMETTNNIKQCVANKPCTLDSECNSIPGISERDTCNEENGYQCNFTSACVSGFCQRSVCKSSTDCGFFEACILNNPVGKETGVCLAVGNECSSSSNSSDAASKCWGAYFPCALSPDGKTGFCSQCLNDNACNLSTNINSGPGSFCGKIDDNMFQNITVNPPSVCKLIDNNKYKECPEEYISVAQDLYGYCCKGSVDGMCGKVCFDDFQCDNNCPYCVTQFDGAGSGICSCIRTTPFSYSNNTQSSSYSCSGGFGITIDENKNRTDDQINPNKHYCTSSNNSKCIANFDVNVNGDTNCNVNQPYCTYAISDNSGKCSNKLEGSRCNIDSDGNRFCSLFDKESGIYSRTSDYVCGSNNLCKAGKLLLGENCTGQETDCGEGLVCSNLFPKTNGKNKKVCISTNFGILSLDI